MRGNSSLDRSEEYAASSQRDSLDNVCIYSTDRRRKNSKHEEMKACCQLVRVLKAIGFSNHAFCELFNLKKKKKKISEMSREKQQALRVVYICKFFSDPIPIIPSLSSPSKRNV